MSTRMTELVWYLRGLVGYFSLVPIKSYFEDLDNWVRRRIRSCYWKQWRTGPYPDQQFAQAWYPEERRDPIRIMQ